MAVAWSPAAYGLLLIGRVTVLVVVRLGGKGLFALLASASRFPLRRLPTRHSQRQSDVEKDSRNGQEYFR